LSAAAEAPKAFVEPFYMVPKFAHRAIAQEIDGTNASHALSTYNALRLLANYACKPDGPFEESVAQIARHAGLGYNTAEKAIKGLQSIGVLEVTPQYLPGTKMRGKSVYSFPVSGEAMLAIRATLTTEAPPRRAESIKEPRRTVKELNPISSPPAPVYESEFDRIWEAYPKKSGKKQAKPEIVAAIKSKGFPFILEAVQAYAAAVASWPKDDHRFVPDPVRWFKRGNYDDDRSTWLRTVAPSEAPAKRSDSVWALRERQKAMRAEIYRMESVGVGKGYRSADQCKGLENPGSYWLPGCEEKWWKAKNQLAELEAQIGGIDGNNSDDS
jgi:hypothetical protein